MKPSELFAILCGENPRFACYFDADWKEGDPPSYMVYYAERRSCVVLVRTLPKTDGRLSFDFDFEEFSQPGEAYDKITLNLLPDHWTLMRQEGDE